VIEIILGLLRYIDECHDDVVFFDDEAGSWQVGVAWSKVLPAFFSCLRATEPPEFARRVVEAADEFDRHTRGKHMTAALRVSTAAQRKALRARPNSFARDEDRGGLVRYRRGRSRGGTGRIRESVPARVRQPPAFASVRIFRDGASRANLSRRKPRERVRNQRPMRSTSPR
jgi:hypothetical protein